VASDVRAIRTRAEDVAALAAMPDFSQNTSLLAALAFRTEQFYSACEAALVRVLRGVDGGISASATWHQQVLEDATLAVSGLRPALIGQDTQRGLTTLLGFRHFLRHAYAVDLDPRRLLARSQDVATVAACLERDLGAVAAWLRA
jgi:hypothetical protein